MASELQRRVAAEVARNNFTTHGLSRDSWYNSCKAAQRRVANDPDYQEVGMYEPWTRDLGSFVLFMRESFGPKRPGDSIDRINPFLGYFPDNVRPADKKTQAINTQWRWFLETLVLLYVGHEGCRRDCLCDWSQRQQCGCGWAQLHPLAADEDVDCSEPQLADVELEDDGTCGSLCDWRARHEHCTCLFARANRLSSRE